MRAGALALCLVGWAAASAHADLIDERARLHVYAGMFGSAHLVTAQATDYRRGYLDHGGGGGLFGGVRLNRLFSIEANLRTTINGENFARARVTNIPIDAVVVTSLGVGGKLHVPTGTIFEPYGHASAGYALITADFVECPDCDTVFAGGPALELGAGVDVHLTRLISAGLRATGQVMHFGSDSFEKRLRLDGFQPSQTQTTILSFATDAYAAFHF